MMTALLSRSGTIEKKEKEKKSKSNQVDLVIRSLSDWSDVWHWKDKINMKNRYMRDFN